MDNNDSVEVDAEFGDDIDILDDFADAPASDAGNLHQQADDLLVSEVSADEPVADVPAVEELQGRLKDVDAAMELLQAGELDAAERAIEALESRVTSQVGSVAAVIEQE